jgi:hypothetical protein
MRLDRAVIDIRPRRIFEILDLALRFYRIHVVELLKTAVMFSLPAFASGLVLYHLSGAFLLGLLGLWLVLPLSSHAVLLAASRLVFGAEVSLASTASLYRPYWLGLFFRRLFQRLHWVPLLPLVAGAIIRLSFVFSPMIVLLERLVGLPGALRRKSLGRDGGARAFGFDLAVIFVTLTIALALSFAVDLVASDIVDIWEFGGMFEDISSSSTKVALWFGILVIVSPFVDLAWFFFYLDTRIRKEGWDLELGFKAMAKRGREQAEDAA